MRRYLAIPLLISIYIVCSSKSCSREDAIAPDEAATVTAAIDSIRNEADPESLSEQALYSYSRSAGQKFQDFSDYLKIANDSSTSIAFREKAVMMARSLFISDKVRIGNPFQASKQRLTIDLLLSECLANNYPKEYFTIESITEEQALRRVNDSLYTGRLAYKISVFRDGTPKPGKLKGSVEIHVARVSKDFGEHRIRGWKVYLGEMQ